MNTSSSDDLVDALLAASRALVAVAARSLLQVTDDVTLVQYRVLVELASRGSQRLADLAGILGVDPSTATRMCDRLEHKGLVSRERTSKDRRAVYVLLQPLGLDLVRNVTACRRAELAEIAARLPPGDRHRVLKALRTFAEAAGGAPEQGWSLGWRPHEPAKEHLHV